MKIHIHISKNKDIKTPPAKTSIDLFPEEDTRPEVVSARDAIVAMFHAIGTTLFEAKPVTKVKRQRKQKR